MKRALNVMGILFMSIGLIALNHTCEMVGWIYNNSNYALAVIMVGALTYALTEGR